MPVSYEAKVDAAGVANAIEATKENFHQVMGVISNVERRLLTLESQAVRMQRLEMLLSFIHESHPKVVEECAAAMAVTNKLVPAT